MRGSFYSSIHISESWFAGCRLSWFFLFDKSRTKRNTNQKCHTLYSHIISALNRYTVNILAITFVIFYASYNNGSRISLVQRLHLFIVYTLLSSFFWNSCN